MTSKRCAEHSSTCLAHATLACNASTHACLACAAVLQYMMTMWFGSSQQPAALVVDTGSGSLYTSGFSTEASYTARDTGIHPILGYGSGDVEGARKGKVAPAAKESALLLGMCMPLGVHPGVHAASFYCVNFRAKFCAENALPCGEMSYWNNKKATTATTQWPQVEDVPCEYRPTVDTAT